MRCFKVLRKQSEGPGAAAQRVVTVIPTLHHAKKRGFIDLQEDVQLSGTATWRFRPWHLLTMANIGRQGQATRQETSARPRLVFRIAVSASLTTAKALMQAKIQRLLKRKSRFHLCPLCEDGADVGNHRLLCLTTRLPPLVVQCRILLIGARPF